MFDYSLAHWVAFFTAAFLLNLSPGPDMAYILGHTAKGGKRAGMFAMFGVWCGALLHVVFSVIGLSAIIATSATAFSLVKWLGAGYLIWLGVQALRSQETGVSALTLRHSLNRQSKAALLRQGILVSLLNPKVAIFFLAFLPQFVEVGAGPESLQILLHGILIIVVAAFIEIPIIFLGAQLKQLLLAKPSLAAWLDRTLGAVFIALGIRLALSQR